MKIDFDQLKQQLRGYEDALLWRILPYAKRKGREYLALNPTRHDQRLGSFRINANTFKWADFATGDTGGDIISLWAYVRQVSQLDAAKEIKIIIGQK